MKKIGNISHKITQALNRPDLYNKEVYIGKSTITHIKNSHPDEYKVYFSYISEILNTPDYVCINKKDSSIELVKEFKINSEYIKLAIRISSSGRLSHSS